MLQLKFRCAGVRDGKAQTLSVKEILATGALKVNRINQDEVVLLVLPQGKTLVATCNRGNETLYIPANVMKCMAPPRFKYAKVGKPVMVTVKEIRGPFAKIFTGVN